MARQSDLENAGDNLRRSNSMDTERTPASDPDQLSTVDKALERWAL
ncbi:hypothetical protein PC129_g9335 [Phytophthora cactorum]|uniref:Uncharacterized protein n=1 Tax=Phytophthora cactorum TaxID=29920 RepID=A0A8T1I7Y4_9STRA|nr:hypothetical protein Pcac1_g7984 [Phytophthora cactorum]KAG2813097.1 hypothetical protein PC112_g14880 [Phytophthora cactorum]KAG2814833.1 hypothetical protein PC111_g13805 [Phytophthora cactorum]KAG2893483.1 hypothetical protein PC114_g16245 [Phytophthora cactorum]KAG2923631.1 hypothetical protein PC117_g15680 [Phytophthora cactorum]